MMASRHQSLAAILLILVFLTSSHSIALERGGHVLQAHQEHLARQQQQAHLQAQQQVQHQQAEEAEEESLELQLLNSDLMPIGKKVLHFTIIVSPTKPLAGTRDAMLVKLEGTSSSMASFVPLAAGFTTGQVLDLNVIGSEPGSVTSIYMKLQGAVAEGDPCLFEVLSYDEKYGFPEDGTKRYTNFANPDQVWITDGVHLADADGAVTDSSGENEGGDAFKPASGKDYVVIIRTSSFEHAGTNNEISIRFLGTDSSSEIITLVQPDEGIEKGSSVVKQVTSANPIVTNIRQIELGINFKSDDLWMPDTVIVYTPYQRVAFRNSGVQFIGFKPYVIASDQEKLDLIAKGESPY